LLLFFFLVIGFGYCLFTVEARICRPDDGCVTRGSMGWAAAAPADVIGRRLAAVIPGGGSAVYCWTDPTFTDAGRHNSEEKR
jgi:hypothetical protein